MAQDDGFREDFVIANDDGYLYYLTQKDLQEGTNLEGKPYRLDPKADDYKIRWGKVLDLLHQGLVLGAVPKDEDVDRTDVTLVPGICYVLNIDALKHYNKWDPWNGKTE